jgi:hypothetical protein
MVTPPTGRTADGEQGADPGDERGRRRDDGVRRRTAAGARTNAARDGGGGGVDSV